MKDFQLYQQLLGLTEPWRVAEVTLRVTAREMAVRVNCAATLWGCPECQRRMHVHDYEERRWRHLPSGQFPTIIVARVPGLKCPVQGCRTVAVPWAEPYARCTRLFERLAIEVMLECSITGASAILGISWDEADGIKQRAVQRGLARKVPAVMPRLCVDEKGLGGGQNYLTIVAQVTAQQTTVEYVGEERTQASLDGFWTGLTAAQLAGVAAVAMDMWQPYVRSTLAHLPAAASKIVHDPCHLVAYLNGAVNEVRRQEHRRLQAAGDATLTGTRQWWRYGMEKVPPQVATHFQSLRQLNLQTARAWGIKEGFRSFWLCADVQPARSYFANWYAWAIRSRLAPVKKVARRGKKHLPNILTFFVPRLTHGPMAGRNNKIQGLIKKAYGYRNKQRFKADLFFHLGGLDLYPSQ